MTDDGTVPAVPALPAALVGLHTALRDLRLPLELPGVAAHRRDARRLVDQIDDHLLPRARQAGAPLLAVVGASTGAGKSTLVNSLVGADVTPAGVLRPTTRSPVLVHHPDDAPWFTTDRILPGLPRVTGAEVTGRALRLVAHPAVPRGVGLLDAPDIDSVVAANRELGEELLGAADLWVFVTTGARYADAVPWDLLDEARRRHAVIALVLNRVDAPAAATVAADLGRMLAERGPADARLLTVVESPLTDGRLPAPVVAELAGWLRDAVGDPATRLEVLRRTMTGALADVGERARDLADACDAQEAAVGRLRAAVTAAFAAAGERLEEAMADGSMLRGEVLARWQEFIGTGELLRAVESTVSGLRDRVTAFLRGRPAPEPVGEAIGAGIVDLVLDLAEAAAERAHATWRSDPAGLPLADSAPGLARASADLRGRIAAEVRAWQGDVLRLVGEEGAGKRTTARVLSFGVNGLGVALMIVIFSATGGLTTAEVGVAGGTALLAQRLLEAVFGDDAVRRLTTTAQADLQRRMGALLDAEAARHTGLLDALDLTPGAGGAVRAATDRLAAVVDAAPRPAPRPTAPARSSEEPEPAGGRLREWWRRLWR